MTISAKFQGKCTACGGIVNIGDRVMWTRGVKGVSHLDLQACSDALQPKPPAPTATVDLMPVVDFLKSAQERGLKRPRLRVLDSDGESELQLSLTGPRSRVPGSVAVKRNEEYLGVVRPTGEAWGRSFDAALVAHLLGVATNPAKAAGSYAALTGKCSFCYSSLTDAGSIEVGYGPVCAKRWGLPHVPAGTPALNLRALIENPA
jgi:hypothetical protein